MKKVSLSAFSIHGNPQKPINDVFSATIIDYKISSYNFKSGAKGYQTVFTVGFIYMDEKVKREIVLQHPFVSENEQSFLLNTRGSKWRALFESLRLNQEQTERFCTFLDGTENNDLQRYFMADEPQKCCKCDEKSHFTVIVNNKNYVVCENHAPQKAVHIYMYQNIFLIGKNVFVKIQDATRDKYPQNYFLTEDGYNHLLKKENVESQEIQEINIDETDAPDDDFGA